jgi:hypothetical protein
VTEFLPPQAPGGRPPGRWEPPAAPRPDSARIVVANTTSAPQVVESAGQPPRNTQAVTGLVLGLVGIGLLVVSAGLSFLVSLPCAAIAWSYGLQGRRRAERDGVAGYRQAKIAVRLGMGGVVLCVICGAIWAYIVISG